jgi:Bacterial Ig domain
MLMMAEFRSLVRSSGKQAIKAVLFLTACGLTASFAEAQTFSCNPPMANPIVCENSKPGNPSSEWDVSRAGDSSIQGFATDISVNQGQTVHFKINTNAIAYRIDIYRMGYYAGMGARRVASVQPSAWLPQIQPTCLSESSTGLIDCGNWAESASWVVPADATSGIYFAKLVRLDTGGASHVLFVVRADAGKSDLLFQTSDTGWEAYNSYGGNSLYLAFPAGRAYKVSYNRPFLTRDVTNNPTWVFNAEYPMVRWLEANGYNISYFTGVDADRFGSEILSHKVFISVGHDEYWSGNQRANVEAARAAGIHLAFFSGNESFWKTRWENSIDGSNATYRTLVCYKETHANAAIDPDDPPTWTGTWRDPRFSPPADGGRPENALSGTIYYVDSYRRDSITVPAAYGTRRFWRNTSIATLAPGTTYTFPAGTLGYEWDQDMNNGFRPAGLIDLSSTTLDVSDTSSYLLDYGSTYGAGVATHSLTLYRASSGALVFGAGTVQWSWGLDNNHDNGSSPPDPNMQQATVNLFADMGIQPATLQPGLVAAAASTDTILPTSTITAPAAGSIFPSGGAVTITGNANDSGGGVVAAVEVSVDSGATWHRASGLNNWTYAWTPSSSGQVTLKSRAIDDSLNMEIPSAGVTVTVATSITLSSLTLNPSGVTGGNSSTGTVTLSNPASNGAVSVTLSSSNTTVASVPASVTVPAGATSATFTVTTFPVAFSTSVNISASYLGTTQTANLTVSSLASVPGL